MSWRQRRLSKSMEAFISSMIAAGLAAKRPPHMVLVTTRRALCQKQVSEEDVNRTQKRDRDASPATISHRRAGCGDCRVRHGIFEFCPF